MSQFFSVPFKEMTILYLEVLLSHYFLFGVVHRNGQYGQYGHRNVQQRKQAESIAKLLAVEELEIQ